MDKKYIDYIILDENIFRSSDSPVWFWYESVSSFSCVLNPWHGMVSCRINYKFQRILCNPEEGCKSGAYAINRCYSSVSEFSETL